jgi:hypothetical protein
MDPYPTDRGLVCVTGIGAPCRRVWEKLSRRAKTILPTQG